MCQSTASVQVIVCQDFSCCGLRAYTVKHSKFATNNTVNALLNVLCGIKKLINSPSINAELLPYKKIRKRSVPALPLSINVIEMKLLAT